MTVQGSEDLMCRWAQALAEATGRSVAQINKEYDEEGDLGIVAASARGKQKPMFKPTPLTIAGVADPSPFRRRTPVACKFSKQKRGSRSWLSDKKSCWLVTTVHRMSQRIYILI